MVSSEVTQTPKKQPPFPAALKLITGRRQTEWTGATRCPNEDNSSHRPESLTDRKRTILFSFHLPCRPLADGLVPRMLRGAPRLRRDALLIRGLFARLRVGPGSAEQRKGRCTASGTRNPTS